MATAFDPSAILSQATEGFLKLPLIQKILFPLLIVGSITGIMYVSRLANQPDYSVLYSDLSPADSAAVIERMKEQKIKYEIRGDGTTIAVSPSEIVPELRMSLAAEGIPKGGTMGYELFDQTSNLGLTALGEKIKSQRALQGELERTISSLDAVLAVRVHITQPEKSVFAKQGSEATASVMLKLRPGAELERKQIKGIANLVAGSVEGLKTDNVAIIDMYGNLLTPSESEKGEDSMGGEATRIQYQREIEKGYALRVEQMLQKVLGPGKVIARVTADLDFSSNEREEESFDPSGQVIRSERSISEGTGLSQRGGVPGVVSNLSNDPNLLSPKDGDSSNAARNENVKNYEVSRALMKSSSPRGKLTRLSIAVLVDGTYETTGTGPEAKKTFRPLGAEVLSQIESLVKGAVGFDAVRGDAITVENIPFFDFGEDAVAIMSKKESFDYINLILQRILPILLVFLFFVMIVRPLVKFLVTPTEAELDLERLLPTGVAELEKELESERQKPGVPQYEPSVDMEQLEELMSENSRIVKENPQQAALLIRYWLNDGRL
jgi:flagellar M-ring protein FliF